MSRIFGEAGDMVNVKDGYARNFLIPQNYAEVATKGAVKNREQNLQRIKIKQERLHNEALELASKIEALGQIELTAKAVKAENSSVQLQLKNSPKNSTQNSVLKLTEKIFRWIQQSTTLANTECLLN